MQRSGLIYYGPLSLLNNLPKNTWRKWRIIKLSLEIWIFFAGFSPVTAVLHPVYNLVEFLVQALVYTALLNTVKSCRGTAQSIVNNLFQSKVVLMSCCVWKAFAWQLNCRVDRQNKLDLFTVFYLLWSKNILQSCMPLVFIEIMLTWVLWWSIGVSVLLAESRVSWWTGRTSKYEPGSTMLSAHGTLGTVPRGSLPAGARSCPTSYGAPYTKSESQRL